MNEQAAGNHLRLECMAAGSVPYKEFKSAQKLNEVVFNKIPFWAQMTKVSEKEDMCFQFLEGMPSFFAEDLCINTAYPEFNSGIQTLIKDYDQILSKNNHLLLEKYAISSSFASAFGEFAEFVKENKPEFMKGQVTGAYTILTELQDQDGNTLIENQVLKGIIPKFVVLKALWQIEQMAAANPSGIPIVFIDEPAISKVPNREAGSIIKQIADLIKSAGAMCGLHCCGECDWSIPLSCGVDMISFDAYSHFEIFAGYYSYIREFLESGGKLVWGIVPTSNSIEFTNVDLLLEKFRRSVNYLTNKGINEKLIIDNSLVSTSCGAGCLTTELADKAFKLTKDLSERLKDVYR